MKQDIHRFMRAMLFIVLLFTGFLGVAASTPGLLTETDLPKTSKPDIYTTEGVGKYTVMISSVMGSEVYCRINSGEWFRYKSDIVFDELGSYLIEAYAVSYQHSPSDIASKTIVVDEHTGENLVDPDADDPSIIFHDGFKYKIKGSTLSLTRQTDAMCSGDLVIPSSITYNGVTYPVTEVESWACYSTNNITSVQIPSTVTEIGLYAFTSCPKLRSITVDPDNPNYCDRDGVLYNKAGIYLLSYPNARATSYEIPDGVTMIYYSAFQEDFDLESVTIPNSVTSIRTSAFSCCFSLQSIVLPNNLGVWDASTFRSCRELKSVVLSSRYSKIPEWAFSNCYSLESIVIPGNVKTIAYQAFEECTSLSSVTLSEGLQSINDNAFSGCRSIPEITIPSTVTSMGGGVFYRCSSLTNIYVNPANSYYCDVDGVLYNKNQTTLLAYPPANPRLSYDILPTTKTVGKQALYQCKNLENISIPSGLTTTEESAFSGCSSLKSIFIPNTLTSMGSYAFYGCTNLVSVTLEDGLKVIGEYAFESCKSLRDFNFIDGLTTIKRSAFRACSSLTKVTLPNSITSIGDLAFYSCSSLTSINFPPNVTQIPYGILEYCSNLKEITIPAWITSIGDYAFYNTPLTIVNCLAETPPTINDSYCFANSVYRNATLCVPPASVEAYQSANVWSNFIKTQGFFSGDANGDGELNISDAIMLINYIINGNTGTMFSVNADVNADGVVNISDAVRLISMLSDGD